MHLFRPKAFEITLIFTLGDYKHGSDNLDVTKGVIWRVLRPFLLLLLGLFLLTAMAHRHSATTALGDRKPKLAAVGQLHQKEMGGKS